MQSYTKQLELFDETLDINATENYELALQAGPDGLSFCILDALRNKMVLIRSYEPDETRYLNAENIRDCIIKDDFLTRSYKKVFVIVPSAKSTLIPSQLYDPARKDDYFRFNHKNDDTEIILANKLQLPDAFIAFALNRNLNDVLNEYYPGVHPNIHLTPLLSQLSRIQKDTGQGYFHTHIERDYINILYFRSKELKLCNTFKYRNISDILYYVLNVADKLGLSRETVLNITGQAQKYDELSSAFSMYIRNISYSSPAASFSYSYVFNDIELHRYINLFGIFNCV